MNVWCFSVKCLHIDLPLEPFSLRGGDEFFVFPHVYMFTCNFVYICSFILPQNNIIKYLCCLKRTFKFCLLQYFFQEE